jgi:hypothetical protein
MVAMVLMAVMTLIVLGFAEISRRDQRETLDRQLSTQAFYAAETGVNDAHSVIESALNSGAPINDRTQCTGNDQYVPNYGVSNVLDAADAVSYTCLLVNTTPPSLLYTLSPGDSSKVFPLESSDGSTIKSVKLQWGHSLSDTSGNPAANCPNSTQLPPANNWPCGYGAIRVDLLPLNGATTSRSGLLANTFTAFFIPTPSGPATSVNFNGSNLYGGSANQGSLLKAHCTAGRAGQCTMTINITSTNSAQYYMRVSAIYKDMSLNVYAYNRTGAAGTQLTLKNAQALVDVTGQAQDVLRRIQVRIPMSNNGALDSDYAIESTNSLCKEFTTYPAFAQDASGVAGCALP